MSDWFHSLRVTWIALLVSVSPFRHAKLCSSRSKRADQAGWRAKGGRKGSQDSKVARTVPLGRCAHRPESLHRAS